jgi:hypothetical protein
MVRLATAGRTYSLVEGTPQAAAKEDRTRPSPAYKAAKVSYYAAGHYSCGALIGLWIAAGGSPGASHIAASIATAESSGNSWAVSPTNDYGLWQINGSHGYLATLNPWLNAKAAIIISSDGTNWNPWTTYRSGAYLSSGC